VPADKVDPIYFDRPYYLAPDKGGEKAYRLLVEVMRQSGRAAIARYAAHDRLYLVMLRPVPGAHPGSGGLVMQQLLYADEVRPLAEVPIPEGQASEAELKLASQVVEQIASDSFDSCGISQRRTRSYAGRESSARWRVTRFLCRPRRSSPHRSSI